MSGNPRARETDVTLRDEQFRVENGSACRASDRIVAQRNEPVIKHSVRQNAADRDAHSTSRAPIQAGLWSVEFFSDYQGFLGGTV